MKESDKSKTISTIPKGVWEASRPAKDKSSSTPTTDLQGNGYPQKQGK